MVNLSDAQLAVAMAQKSKCLIQIIHEDGNTVQAMRKAIDDHNFYAQVSVQQAMLERLPYAENLINILLIQDYSGEGEFARFVRKNGTCIHHFCLLSDDIEEDVKRMERRGIEMEDKVSKTGLRGKKIAFSMKNALNGIPFELSEP